MHGFCLVLLAARALHAYGIAQVTEHFAFASTGMATTAVLLVAAAGLLLYSAIR